MTGHVWLAARAALALALMVSFYLLALGVSFGLLWLAYADLTYTRHPNLKLVFFCVVGGLSVLWAIIPRPDRFEAPGPRVAPAQEPQLFDALRQVAAATSQAMPEEVYIVNDVNAFVTQRGGVMGFGSRRVMGLGLPLMQALTVQEFRGVLAHEFGHYYSGDVGLGPWIHKTRVAIGRTIHQLSDNILQKIFVAYGNLFLRVTHAVSRRQEFIADEVAAKAAGAGAMISGLRKVHAAALAFRGYWQGELAPILGSGYLPPVSQGFGRFMASASVAAGMDAAVRHEEAEGATDPYDTHPSLRDRITALQSLPQGSEGDTRPAVALLTNVLSWERRVLGTVVNEDWARGLKAVEWDTVAETVYLPLWRNRTRECAKSLAPLTPATIPTTEAGLAKLAPPLPADEAGQGQVLPAIRAVHLLLSAIGLLLIDRGWTAHTAPGDEIVLRRGGREVRLYSELMALAGGQTTADQWRSRCLELGIADVPLGGAAVVN